ncbi:hypothetical protein [Aequorivita echinoideorum]|uniref:GLPGLI family protein n=1 Tax=Aequorivita echinoideorum TaxID=1549647 RepID=A0ABS5S7P6_9FLAO|nr:hypothetical protein [Aequorivita echinoideorum]MBT0609236.1 hypothetical protein [Aequorivita echinoideorum]
MKQKLTILFAVITLTAFGQKNQTVDLKWKIGSNEKLNYLTAMSDIDTSSIEMDFGGLFKALSDSTDNGLKESKSFFKKFNDAFKNQDYVTTLSNKDNGVIDIVMTTRPKEPIKETDIDTTDSKEKEVLKMMQSMTQGVMLRGSVYETGGIHSFWVKSAQKNLIALFFELPTKPVKVGDKWSLDINLITNDQNFDCDSSYKINEVMLIDIKTIDGEKIAVLKYNIVEYVKGNFNTPAFFGSDGGQKETMMKFTHQGIAEFSVDKGRWVNYDGIMSLEATGVMTANKKTKFTLIDEKNASR